jgi:hypothetical protein
VPAWLWGLQLSQALQQAAQQLVGLMAAAAAGRLPAPRSLAAGPAGGGAAGGPKPPKSGGKPRVSDPDFRDKLIKKFSAKTQVGGGPLCMPARAAARLAPGPGCTWGEQCSQLVQLAVCMA